MNIIASTKFIAAAAALFALAACGGGTDPGGRQDGDHSRNYVAQTAYAPMAGMDYHVTDEKIDVRPNEEAPYQYVSSMGSDGMTIKSAGVRFTPGEEGRTGLIQSIIRAVKGEQSYTISDFTHMVPVAEKYESSGEEYYNTKHTTEVVNIGGESVLKGTVAPRHFKTGEFIGNNQYIYVPADDSSDMNVGMLARPNKGDPDTSYYALFGKHITKEQMAQQRGYAEYVGHTDMMYLDQSSSSNGNAQYAGDVRASINFDAAGGPSIHAVATTSPEGRSGVDMGYEISGKLNQNGSITDATMLINGQSPSQHSVQGGLYGDKANSLGYVFDGAMSKNAGESYQDRFNGGAILNKQ